MTRYLNMKNVYGVETVDQLESENFKTYKEFKIELKRLVNEYFLCNMNVYISQKCCKDWKN